MKISNLLFFSFLLSAGLACGQEAVRKKPDNDGFGFSGGPSRPEAEVNDGALERLIRHKLKSIKFPNVSLESVPLDVALDTLANRSIELDTLEPDPAKRGVNIIHPQWSSHDDGPAAPEVSVEGKNLSLEEIISLVVRSAGKKWRVRNGAVVIGDYIWGPNIDDDLVPEIAKMLAEWDAIILPSVDFKDTPLSEVVDAIRRKAVEFDSVQPTLPFRLHVHPSTEDLKSAGHRISLKLRNASAFDVLAHAFARAGYDFDVGENEFLVDDLGTDTYALEWDHWLWIMRIAKRDPDFTPADFDPKDQTIRMYERKSAKQIYEDCGINVGKSESFIYGVVSTQMIARLGGVNRERLEMIHKTIEEWKAGRTDQWHLNWIP